MTAGEHALGPQQSAWVVVGAFVDELVRSGVRHFCVAPGSRSTPLALAIAEHPRARVWMHLDERSCGFFGLGLAKASREPVALLCSSGTAAANFLPAVVEASYARVPLVVLTADRPHELREVGAPQAIDQVRLYGVHARWFVDMEEPEASTDLVRFARSVAARAVATARRGPAGPVHVNWPFREPLVPTPVEMEAAWRGRTDERPYVAVEDGRRVLDSGLVNALARRLERTQRGLIVCGPQDDPDLAGAVADLARALDFPILADPLSGIRCGPHDRSCVVDAYDAFLRSGSFVDRVPPELVLRFGALPTSKPVLQYLQRYPDCEQIVVDGDGGWNEPTSLATDVVHTDAALLCRALVQAGVGMREPAEPRNGQAAGWADAWIDANRRARTVIHSRLGALEELFEGKVFGRLATALPNGATLYAGNSMPVRDLDTFFPSSERRVRFLSNRGANGIDGVVSSALGASVAGKGPTVLAIGDVSFYHDLNGLLAARQHHLDLTVVLLHNDGGGIFNFLPQAAEAPERFEQLFGTPHGLDFEPFVRGYGGAFTRISSWQDFDATLARGISGGGLHVVEVPTERRRNVALHREIWPAVADAVAAAPGPLAHPEVPMSAASEAD